MGRKLYWPHLGNKDYTAVLNCQDCAINCTKLKKKRHLKLILTNSSLAIIAIDKFFGLPATKTCNQSICIVSDRYRKLIRTISSSKTSAPLVALMFIDHWVVTYVIPASIYGKSLPACKQVFRDVIYIPLGDTTYEHRPPSSNKWSSGMPKK